MMILKKKTCLIFITVLMFCLVIATLGYNAVDNSLSEEDMQYIPKFLVGIDPLPEKLTFKDELKFISAVQRRVLEIAPDFPGLPFGQKRDPKELYIAKTGLCFDRSRVIEKILRYSGFKTRHISIYAKKKYGSAIKTLFTPGGPSHAISEVLTSRGWLVIDSNAIWLSLDKNDQPIPLEELWFGVESSKPIEWKNEIPFSIYNEPFVFVYGLYSRHGKFYPPYNFVPDIHMGEFAQNFL